MTYSSSADAQDAIDNMDLNEMQGKVIKVNLARPMKSTAQPDGNRASKRPHRLRVLSLPHRTRPNSQSGSQKNGSKDMPNRLPKVEVCLNHSLAPIGSL